MRKLLLLLSLTILFTSCDMTSETETPTSDSVKAKKSVDSTNKAVDVCDTNTYIML